MAGSSFRSLNMTSKNMSLVLGPVLNLVVRLWMAQMFLFSAAMQLSGADHSNTPNIYACFEDWLTAQSLAQIVLLSASMVFAALLAAGLASRLAALVLAVFSLAAYGFDAGQAQNLLWALLLLYVALFGAGPLSVDALLARERPQKPESKFSNLLQNGFLFALRQWLVLVILLGVLEPSAAKMVPDFLLQHSFVSGFLEQKAHFVMAVLAIGFLLPGFLARPVAGLMAPILLVMAITTSQAENMYLAALLGFIASSGPGLLTFDHWWKLDRWPSVDLGPDEDVPHIVVVGAGFAGLTAVSRLAREKCRITLIDRHNYHLFQPLLYQVATAALSPADISLPIRTLFKGRSNVQVLLAEVTGIDRENCQVLLGHRRVKYDRLIIATGSNPGYHGKDLWEQQAPGLKHIEDATYIRSRLLAAFEHAEDAVDEASKLAWTTFVIVGGGATGVEMAGALAELASHGLRGEFRNFDPAKAKIILLNRGPRCLSAFSKASSKACEKTLNALGVEVRNEVELESIDVNGVSLADGSKIAARTVLWAAGVTASPAAKWLGVEAKHGGRVPVTSRLSLEDDDRIFVIGDTAAIFTRKGKLVPGLAPAAKQAGQYVAKVLVAQMAGWPPPKPFSYSHQGSLATIGRSSAVADFGWIKISGSPAWWLCGLIHVGFLTGVRNRIAVALQWFWAYLTYHRSTRLITGLDKLNLEQ